MRLKGMLVHEAHADWKKPTRVHPARYREGLSTIFAVKLLVELPDEVLD